MKLKSIWKKLLIGAVVTTLQPWGYINTAVGSPAIVQAAEESGKQPILGEFKKVFVPEDVSLRYMKLLSESSGSEQNTKGEALTELYKTMAAKIKETIDSGARIEKSEDSSNDNYVISIWLEKSLGDMGLEYTSQSKDVKKVFDALRYDHPEWYWMKNHFKVTKDGRAIEIAVLEKYREASAREQIEQKVMDQLNEIDKKIGSKDDTYTKVQVIHDYLITHTQSSEGDTDDDSIVNVLTKGKGSFYGYARAMQLLCNYYKITNNVVPATEKNTTNKYMWNQVLIAIGDIERLWVDVDVYMDDLTKSAEQAKNYDENLKGISYRYFCRDESEFKHITACGGIYQPDYAIQNCANDKYNNYRNESSFYYIDDKTDISNKMGEIVSRISKGEVASEDGVFWVRIGMNCSKKMLTEDSVKEGLKADNYVCTKMNPGLGEEYIAYIENTKSYKVFNETTETNGTLYTSKVNVKDNQIWSSDSETVVSVDQNAFYIVPSSGYTVSEISYQRNDGAVTNMSLASCLKPVEEKPGVYRCVLPFKPVEKDRIKIKVSYTQGKVVEAYFENQESSKIYGEAIDMNLHVTTLDPLPKGSFSYYYKGSNNSLIEIVKGQKPSSGVIKQYLNSDDGSGTTPAQIPAGTYEVIAKYRAVPGESYTDSIVASAKVTVTKAELRFRPNPVVSQFGESVTLTGEFVESDFHYNDAQNVSSIRKRPTLKVNADRGSTPGGYDIKEEEAGEADNYKIVVDTSQRSRLTIEKTEPNVSLIADKTSAAVGDTIRLTAQVSNKAYEELTKGLPNEDQVTIYVGNQKLGKMKAGSKKGEFYLDYPITKDTDTALVFKVTTDGSGVYYSAGVSTECRVAVDKEKFVVTFVDRKNNTISTQTVAKGGKITPPAEPVDPSGEKQFDGWFTEKPNEIRWSFDIDTVTEPVALFDKWKDSNKDPLVGITIVPYTDHEYDAKSHAAIVSIGGLENGDIVKYEYRGVISSEIPMIKDAGVHDILVTVKRGKYKEYQENVSVVIGKAAPQIMTSVDDVTQVSYTGEPISVKKIRVQGVDGEQVPTKTLRYEYCTDSDLSFPTSEEHGAKTPGGAPSVAGEYYVKVIFEESTNYIRAVGKTKLIITKGNIIDLPNVGIEIAANQEASYQYILKDLLGGQESKYGEVHYKVTEIQDNDSILGGSVVTGTDSIKNDILTYKVNSAPAGKTASITITVHSSNYDDKQVKLVIRLKDKKELKITGVTAADKEYDGLSFKYQGTPQFANDKGEVIADITPYIVYTGTRADGKTYESIDAPSDAGEYTLKVAVPDSNRKYTGIMTYAFKIKVKELIVKAEDIKINLGAAVPEFKVSFTGLAEKDHMDNIKFKCSYVPNDAERGVAGDYKITPSEGVLNKPYNYHVKYSAGILTVKKIHTIQFDTKVDGAKNPETMHESEGTLITMPAVGAVKDGYIFEGWVGPDQNIYRTYEEFTMLDKDVRFIAKWVEKTTATGITAKYYGKEIPVNESVNKGDIKVTVNYSDGASEVVTDFVLDPIKISSEGENVIAVKYKSFTTNVIIKGYKNNVKSITVSYEGTVVNGMMPEESKLKITAKYVDGTTKEIKSGFNVKWSHVVVGKNKFTVNYEGVTAEFEVTGVEAAGQAVITFDAQGGFNNSKAVVDIGKTCLVPQPSKYDCVFKGWYTKPDGHGTVFTSETIVTGSMTVYAFWEKGQGQVKEIYASFHGDMMKGSVFKEDFIVMGVYENNTRGILSGFTISGGNLKIGTNRIAVTYEGLTTTVILKVPAKPRKLKIELKDDLYAEGYSLTNKDMHVSAINAEGELKEVTDFVIENPRIHSGVNSIDVTYDGYTETINVEGRQRCTIIFECNGGKQLDPMYVLADRAIGTLSVPEREHYEFKGWYFEEDFKRKCTETNKIKTNVTLYAKWKRLEPYELNMKNINLRVGEQESLQLQGAEYVQWMADDMNIVGIDFDGIVTGINEGTTIVTAYTQDGYEYQCMITVGKAVKEIVTTQSKVTMTKGETRKIKATVLPKKAVTKKLSYSTSDIYVASVDELGNVKAKGKGTCYIYIKTTDISHLTKKIKVTVK